MRTRRAIELVWAVLSSAAALPLLWSGAAVYGQTTGLVAPMSGDCTTTATGVVTCVAKGGGGAAVTGSAGTLASFNSAGTLGAAAAQPYTATAGPIKVAPYNVSAPTSAGTLIGPYGGTGYRVANITNGARLLTTGQVSQVKTYIASTTGATGLYFELWRVNSSGTFNLACRSQNLLSSVQGNALNTFAITGCNGQAGDYPAMYMAGNFNGQVTTFSASTAYPIANYPMYYANGALMSSTEDFFNGSTGVTYGTYYNVPIEVYLAKGPVIVGMGDSKMQGIPFSGNYLQAAYNGSFQFPVAAQSNYSTASLGTSLIDLSNQPVAWASRVLGYSYANLGITGSTSTVQLQQELPTALQLSPAVLILSGTVNDAAFNIPTNTSLSNYQSMYQQAIAAGVQKVVMTGVEPAGAISEAMWSNSSYGSDALNAALKSYCQGQSQCVWIGDAVSAALGQYRSGGVAGSLHNIQPGFAAADNLHFNNAGAQVMGVLEANAIEVPATAGTAVAVVNPFGTAYRARSVVAVSHDGTLGWRWQDTRDFLQVDSQGLDNAAVTAGGSGTPGQQTIGCVMFAAGKGYVRCDGTLSWSQQQSTLTVPTVSAGTVNATTVSGTTVTGTNVNATNLSASAPAAFGGSATAASLVAYTRSGQPAAYLVGSPGVNGGNSDFILKSGSGQQWDIASADDTAAAFSVYNITLGARPLYVDKNAPTNSLHVVAGGSALPHLIGNSAAPAVAAGAAASGCTVSGTDLGFLLTCTTGSSPAAGTLATVTFAGAYGAAPHFAAPAAVNAASAAAVNGLYAASSTTALTVSTANALQANASYAWHFVLVQ